MSAAAEPLASSTHDEKRFEGVRLFSAKREREHSVDADRDAAEVSTEVASPPADPVEDLPIHQVIRILRSSARDRAANLHTRASAARRVQKTCGNRFVQRLVSRTEGETQPDNVDLQPGFGQVLDDQTLAFMQAAYHTDFRDVRVHTGPDAAEAAQSIRAEAYTIGRDIYFGEGRYAPSSGEGRHLLAHELAHTMQQERVAPSAYAPGREARISTPDDPLELEAEAAATRALSGAAGALPPLSLGAGVVRRWPFSDDKTEREKIDAALKSRDPGDVKAINDVNQANESEKIDLLRILTYQGWVGPRDEWKIEEIWSSFGEQVPPIMARETKLWTDGIAGGADLDKLPAVQKVRIAFLSDVQTLALTYLRKNREYIQAEMKSLGVDEEVPTEEQNQRLKDVQEMATQVKAAQDVEKKLRSVRVGDDYNIPDDGLPFWAPLNFDPEKRPDRNLDKDEANKDRDWQIVKSYWDPVTGFIAKAANQYPTIYAAIQQGETFWGPDDKLGPISNAPSPAKARQAIKAVLSQTLKDIAQCESKIGGNDPDYRDMVPLHAQLLAGTAASTSGVDYQNAFNKWVVEDDLKDYKAREFWVRLGFQTAAAVAFVVVEFATAGTATFFIAAGVGLAASGIQAYNSLDQYLALEQASKTNVKDATAIVDKATVIEAGKKAVADAAAFLLMVATVAGKAIGGLLSLKPKGVPQGLTEEQFGEMSTKVRSGAGEFGDDIRVHGSRAAGTARPDSDIDIAVRVQDDKFNQIVRDKFGTPNPGSAKERTMLHAMETGKIQAGEAGLRPLRQQVAKDLGMDVDISIIRVDGPFDNGPWIPLK